MPDIDASRLDAAIGAFARALAATPPSEPLPARARLALNYRPPDMIQILRDTAAQFVEHADVRLRTP